MTQKKYSFFDDVYEVVLVVTAEAQIEEEPAFLIEVHQAGIFTIKDFDDAETERILATVCPNILFPYAREGIDSLVVKGSFPALMLSPLNFDAPYEQKKRQEQEESAGGEPVNRALEGIEAFATWLGTQETQVDVLVNNAGATWGEPIEEFSEKGWDRVMDLNVKSLFFVTQKMSMKKSCLILL